MSTDVLSRLMLTCRRLFVRNHMVNVRIGAHDFEKHGPQRIIFNVELFVPLELSTPSQDDLAEVVDYDFVREVIARRVARGHIVLQETLCDDVMAELIAHPGVLAVRLSSCKPDVYPDCEAVGVEIVRIKQGPADAFSGA
jgi:dihydroneopterin aldolase